MAHFDALRPKVYRYLINNGDDNKKKAKGTEIVSSKLNSKVKEIV